MIVLKNLRITINDTKFVFFAIRNFDYRDCLLRQIGYTARQTHKMGHMFFANVIKSTFHESRLPEMFPQGKLLAIGQIC